MKKNRNNVLEYKINTALMAEIKSLEQKFQARLKASKMSKRQLIEYLRSLSASNEIYQRSELEKLNFDDLDLKQMLRVLIRKQYALEHGKSVSRGRAYAKQQRKLQNLKKVGV